MQRRRLRTSRFVKDPAPRNLARGAGGRPLLRSEIRGKVRNFRHRRDAARQQEKCRPLRKTQPAVGRGREKPRGRPDGRCIVRDCPVCFEARRLRPHAREAVGTGVTSCAPPRPRGSASRLG